MNVIQNIRGEFIHFAKTEDFVEKRNDLAYTRLMRLYSEVCYHISRWNGYLAGTNVIKQTKDYRLGKALLKPLRYVYRKVFHQRNS